MVRPVASQYPVTLGYRQQAQFDPNYIHRGIDYGCPSGTPVVATRGGTVVYAGNGGGYGPAYGIQVVIRTGDIWQLYAHLSSESVSVGQSIATGQQIGRSGATGNVTGAHLHYQENTQPPAAYKSDRAPQFITWTDKPLVIPVCVWNIARPRWYTPWRNRAAEIQREIRDEAKVYLLQELFDAEPIATVAAALPNCTRVAGRAGLEFFFDTATFKLLNHWDHYSGIANRWAQEVELEDRATGIRVTFLNCHAPIKAEGDTAKARYGVWLQGIEAKTKYKTVIGIDTNAPSDEYSPKKELRAIGYIGYKEQAAITNEATKEFMPKSQDLCDIRTRPGRISGGEVDISTNELESDHRRIEATVVIAA